MKFYSILIVTLGASNYVVADDNINMLRGILPHLKKMKDDGEVVNVLADDKYEEGVASVDKADVFSLEGVCTPQSCTRTSDCPSGYTCNHQCTSCNPPSDHGCCKS